MSAPTISELLTAYQEEIKFDTKIDELNWREHVAVLPSIRAKWVARLINTKAELQHVKRNRMRRVELCVRAVKEQPQLVNLTPTAIIQQASKHESITELDDRIAELDLLVEYLERIEKVFGHMGFDIKNLIEIVKLETT